MVRAPVRTAPPLAADILAFQPGDGLLEAPQYTRPADFHGWKVPEVLLSGNHAEIVKWRKEQAIKRTQENRPDLLG